MYVHMLFPQKPFQLCLDLLTHITKIYKHIQAMKQGVNIMQGHTRYRTFSVTLTWLDNNATCYHNVRMLIPTLPYILSNFSLACDYLQCVTTLYCPIHQKIYINIFLKNMMVIRGNALQKAQSQENLRGNIR